MKIHATKNNFILAEDNLADQELFKELLSQAIDEPYRLTSVSLFSELQEALDNQEFDTLILDMNLPDQSGINNVIDIAETHPNLSIVVLTGYDDLDLAVESLQKGAQDYLSKNNISSDILKRSLRYAHERKLIEIQLKKALEDSAYRNEQLEVLANHDSLTNLPNRAYFNEAANRILQSAVRLNKTVALFYFDLNGFKKVNDTYGHLIGDELLRQVSNRLKKVVRDSDFLARLGGDEFVVLTDIIMNRDEVYSLVNRLLHAFDEDFIIEKHNISSSPSIGVSFFPEANSLDLLIKHADAAMYEAKKSEDNHIYFYSEEMASRFSRGHQIELSLSKAVSNEEFYACFQPIQSVKNPEHILLEALIRWESPELGRVMPDEFIPLAEYTPAMNDMTLQVIDNCAEMIQQLKQQLPNKKIEKIAINICASQLLNEQFSQKIKQWIHRLNIPTEYVCLEITERQIIQNQEVCKKHFNVLHQFGSVIALDDFGSGYSSFSHLLDFEINILKIDRILIDKIDQNTKHYALVAGIIEMAHRMEMTVVAEGIEREEEYLALLELGVDYLQGYFIARPMEMTKVIDFYQ